MISNVLREGMKIDIHIVNQTERPESAEKAAPVYKSQIFELFENGEMEIMMPIQSGKLILLPLGLRYEFVFYTPNGLYKSIGQIRQPVRISLETITECIDREVQVFIGNPVVQFETGFGKGQQYFCITNQNLINPRLHVRVRLLVAILLKHISGTCLAREIRHKRFA